VRGGAGRVACFPSLPKTGSHGNGGSCTLNGQEQLLLAGGSGVPPLVNVYTALPVTYLDSFFAYNPAFMGGAFV
jgi:hypothetical protein